MSDESFNRCYRQLQELSYGSWETIESVIEGMTLTHWGLTAVGLVFWGALMMRGIGLRKF